MYRHYTADCALRVDNVSRSVFKHDVKLGLISLLSGTPVLQLFFTPASRRSRPPRRGATRRGDSGDYGPT
jgi:hypothetical protein